MNRCECTPGKYPFFCNRHNCTKTKREHELCSGVNCQEKVSLQYWDAWESGRLGGEFERTRKTEARITESRPSGGSGTELKKLFSRIGIHATPNCKCNKHAAMMDSKGVKWCEENIETIVGWLEEETLRRNLPFLKIAARKIVRISISRAKKKGNRITR